MHEIYVVPCDDNNLNERDDIIYAVKHLPVPQPYRVGLHDCRMSLDFIPAFVSTAALILCTIIPRPCLPAAVTRPTYE